MLGLALGAGCAGAQVAHQPAWQRQEYRQIHMGVQARIVLWTRDEAQGRRAARAAFARLAQVDAALSDWLVDGELARLETHAGGAAAHVDPQLHACLQLSLELARRTDGAFDPSLGALTRLWRAARATGVAPDPQALERARGEVGWQAIELEPDGDRVRLGLPGMRLDFGAVGKGWGAQRALDVLAEHGIEHALVGLAGDHAVGAAPPGESGWRLSTAASAEVLVLAHCGVATSGDSEQFFELDGVRYSHILDPRTGLGVVARPVVTVIARDAATADALASALSVVGPEHCAALLERCEGVRALWGAP